MNGQIANLNSELENNKKLFSNLSKENKKFRDEIEKKKEIISNLEKAIKKLKSEVVDMKQLLAKTITDFQKQIDEINLENDNEKEGYLCKIHAMQEVINSISNDEKKLKSNYEKKIKDFRREINQITKTNRSTNFKRETSTNFKTDNSKDLKAKIFTNKKYTGNEAKSLFKYLLRSKSMDKNSFLENSKPKGGKTYTDSVRNENRVTTPYRSKQSESLSLNMEKDTEKIIPQELKSNENFDFLLNRSTDKDNFKLFVNPDSNTIQDKELSNISGQILNHERRMAELQRKSQTLKIKLNVNLQSLSRVCIKMSRSST